VVRAGEDALVIGSDQCAVLGETVLGKPGDAERARAQLAACSGRTVEFLTGLCVLDTADDRSALRVVPYRVRFRALTAAQIEAYVALEQPYDCAGSFKAEGLGSALFQSLEGSDPTALIGLPLIELCALLEAFGLPVLERRPD
jgi:septum formation protein